MMTYRTLLRIKVVQMLYAYESNKDKQLTVLERDLDKSISKTTELYFHLLQLSVSVTKYAEECIEVGKSKFCPTPEERNPNMKFVNNQFVAQLRNSELFQNQVALLPVSWDNNPEVQKAVYKLIVESDEYQQYMASATSSFEEDKTLWRAIYEKLIPSCSLLEDALEDQSILWVDDMELALSYVLKTLRKSIDVLDESCFVPQLYKEKDIEFANNLFVEAIQNGKEYKELISRLAKNWDSERIAFMDVVIMLVAISELVSSPTIPVNVTINEYIEIAKMYSTDKSYLFINGILDKAVSVLKAEKKLLKVEGTYLK